MKKNLLFAGIILLYGVASAEPGFLYARFAGSAYDGTSNIWASRTVLSSAVYLYRSGNEYEYGNTTFAYACYMFFRAGITYKFRAGWDDYASVKVDDSMVIPRTSQCGHSYGECSFERDGWHKLELRVSNASGNYGNGGNNMGSWFGIHYSTDDGKTWNSFVSSFRQNVFQTVIPKNYDIVFISNSSVRDADPTILDTTYVVYSNKPTVKVRVLAFEDGERSFRKVVRPETFVTDTNGVETACNVGDNITPNVEHTISWRVSSDWKTKLAKVKFEVLASEGELLPLELMTIPASDQYGKMKISWNAISESQMFDALLWLYADKDAGLKLENGVLKNGNTGLAKNTGLSNGSYTWQDGYFDYRINAANYVYGKMGYSLLTGAPLTYANAETRLGLSPSGARQYAYKIVEE